MSKIFKIEFLLIKEENLKCNSITTLKNLLCSHGDLSFKGQKIKVQDTEVNFKIETGNVGDEEKERYFIISIEKKIEDETEEKVIGDLSFVFKKLKQIISDSNKTFKIVLLWNDTAFYYATLAYPLIFEIENLMRKLIYQFMLIKLGTEWFKIGAPEEFKRDIAKNGRESDIMMDSILYNADFIHVVTFLFREYTRDDKKVIDKIKTAKNSSDIDIDELKSIIPQDNWTRYFQPILDYPEFKQKWEKLYELRCKVAHNSIITKSDYEEIKSMTSQFKEKLQKAILSIDKISVPEEEKIELSQSAFSSFQTIYSNPIEVSSNLNRFIWGSAHIPDVGNIFPTKFTTSSMIGLTGGLTGVSTKGLTGVISSSNIATGYLNAPKICSNCGKRFVPTVLSSGVDQDLCDNCKNNGFLFHTVSPIVK